MRTLLSFASLIIWLAQSSTAFGQPDVDPEADAVLKPIYAYMSALDSLLISAEILEESVYGDTHKLQFGGTLNLGMRRPASLFSEYHTDFENRSMYLNGGTFTIFDEDVNVYAQAPAQGSLHEVFSHLHAKYGIDSPGGELFSGNAYELLVENARKVIYVGESNVNGHACHHIAGVLENMDWQLWVRKKGDPEFCKYLVTDRDVPMAPQFSITFRTWEANADFSDKDFDFQAPDDAEAIEFVR